MKSDTSVLTVRLPAHEVVEFQRLVHERQSCSISSALRRLILDYIHESRKIPETPKQVTDDVDWLTYA